MYKTARKTCMCHCRQVIVSISVDESRIVGGKEGISLGGNEGISLGGNEGISFGGNEGISFGGSESRSM